MPRHRKPNKTGRNQDLKHVRLYGWLLRSSAYRSLSPYGRSLLVELYALYNGTNNGAVFLSVREAARRLGCAAGTAEKALGELQDRGFIAISQRGGFNLKSRHATTWRLTEYSVGDERPTKDFMSWIAPGETNTKIKSRYHEIVPMVSPRSTDTTERPPKKCPTVSRSSTVKPLKCPSSVSPRSTQLVYQAGGVAFPIYRAGNYWVKTIMVVGARHDLEA